MLRRSRSYWFTIPRIALLAASFMHENPLVFRSVQQGLSSAGTWRTSDQDGPYNISLLSVQANEVAGAAAARGSYTDRDIINFLVNVECLEGLFDTWGMFLSGSWI